MRILRCLMPMDIPENTFYPLLHLFTVKNEIFKKSSVNIQDHIFNVCQLSNNQKGKITKINCHVCWLLSLQLRLCPPGGRSACSKVKYWLKIPTWYKWEERREDSNWALLQFCSMFMLVDNRWRGGFRGPFTNWQRIKGTISTITTIATLQGITISSKNVTNCCQSLQIAVATSGTFSDLPTAVEKIIKNKNSSQCHQQVSPHLSTNLFILIFFHVWVERRLKKTVQSFSGETTWSWFRTRWRKFKRSTRALRTGWDTMSLHLSLSVLSI